MPPDPADLDPQILWQSQLTEHDPMSLAVIHEKARTFQIAIGRRNIAETIGCALPGLGFLPAVLHRGSWMMQAGAALVILAAAFVAWQLYRRASARAIPEAGAPLAGFYRDALIRQRDALRSVGVWYMGPFVPGMALMLLGRWLQAHSAHRSVAADHGVILGGAAVVGLIFLGVWLLNQNAANQLQRRIDAL